MTTPCFFTVCGGGEDYEFLLGSIEHHATMGRHVVLDTTPLDRSRSFRLLPKSVIWIYEPIYGAGWHEFRYRDALAQASRVARNFGDVLVHTDSDEYWDRNLLEILEVARKNPLNIQTAHWRKDGLLHLYGDSEWHIRIWPASEEVIFPVNSAWLAHPDYNGNDQHHAVASFRPDLGIVRMDSIFHYHVHHALGEKSSDETVARQTIPNWEQGTVAPGEHSWPERLKMWRDFGVRPSSAFF